MNPQFLFTRADQLAAEQAARQKRSRKTKANFLRTNAETSVTAQIEDFRRRGHEILIKHYTHV